MSRSRLVRAQPLPICTRARCLSVGSQWGHKMANQGVRSSAGTIFCRRESVGFRSVMLPTDTSASPALALGLEHQAKPQ